MLKRIQVGILLVLLGSGATRAQGFLADQFELLIPELSASTYLQLGSVAEACGSSATWNAFVCEQPEFSRWNSSQTGVPGTAIDVLGAQYRITARDSTAGEHNCPTGWRSSLFEVERWNGIDHQLIARFPFERDICIDQGTTIPCEYPNATCSSGTRGAQRTQPLNLMIDAINGHLYVAVLGAQCVGSGCTPSGGGFGIVRITGLPNLLDIILSYQPPSTLSFNVPVRPEGLVGADSFSVYTGDVRTASDLSQATPLECTVPAGRPPIPGEHLTVSDPLPDPAVGDARYYVAAVNYQGQRRAGRTSMNGVMQGRNAAALLGCHNAPGAVQ